MCVKYYVLIRYHTVDYISQRNQDDKHYCNKDYLLRTSPALRNLSAFILLLETKLWRHELETHPFTPLSIGRVYRLSLLYFLITHFPFLKLKINNKGKVVVLLKCLPCTCTRDAEGPFHPISYHHSTRIKKQICWRDLIIIFISFQFIFLLLCVNNTHDSCIIYIYPYMSISLLYLYCIPTLNKL